MKVGQIGPTFVVPGKTVNFWRVKSVVSFSTLKMRKSKKNLHLYTHTHTCMHTHTFDEDKKYPCHAALQKQSALITWKWLTSLCSMHYAQCTMYYAL